MKINEVIIDNVNGAGAVSNNQEVKYLGLQVIMKPSIFLKLTPSVGDLDTGIRLSPNRQEFIDTYNKDFRDYIKKGGSIGAPFLIIDIPDEWKLGNFKKVAKVVGHEGRHRMHFVREVEGDAPIETHLFFGPSIRAQHIKSEWIQRMNHELISQVGLTWDGPFFKVINSSK